MKPEKQNGILKNILYILAGLGGIGLIILIHEAGHFIFAKIFNVPTPVFSLGFGPTLFSLPIGETVFKIALFPFGGYVEMDPEVLAQQNYIPKMLIVFGGIIFNLIFAYCILLFYAIRSQYILTPVINTVLPHSPAEKAGLQPKDVITAYNHQPITSNLDALTSAIASSESEILILTIERNGNQQEIPVTLDAEHPLFGKNARWLGIELEKNKTERSSLGTSLQKGHKRFMTTTQEMSRAITNIMTKKDQQKVILGPIGIISMIGKSLAINPQLYWFILAILSLNIGFFNVLPLPFLDGGKALLFTVEAVTGATIPAHIIWIVSMIFLALFLLFITQVTMNDIKRLMRR